MFFSSSTDAQMEQGYRSEVQEKALVVSLQMFNLILERGVSLLKSQLEVEEKHRLILGEDMQILLPAIKVRFHLQQSIFICLIKEWKFM